MLWNSYLIRTSRLKAQNSFSCGTTWSSRDAMLSSRLGMSSADPAFLFSHEPSLVQVWALLLISQVVNRVVSHRLFWCLGCHGVWQFRGLAGSIWCSPPDFNESLGGSDPFWVFEVKSVLGLISYITLEPLIFKFLRLHVWFRGLVGYALYRVAFQHSSQCC